MKRRNPIFAALTAAVLTAGLPAASALAASNGSAATQQVIPEEVEVWSNNGSSYTHVDSLSNIVADIRVAIDTNGWVNSWKTWIRAGVEEDPVALWANFSNFAFSQSYGQGDKPQDVNRIVQIVIPDTAYKSMAVGYCNLMAADLRQQGLSNDEIFAQDRTVQIGVRAAIQWDSVSGFGNFDSTVGDDDLDWPALEKFNLVCKKWGRSDAPLNDTISAAPPKVVASSLTLLERSGRSGVCKIMLSGVIETTHPDVEVKFRYKDRAGHQSEIFSVTTDHAKSALFSHEYGIPDNPNGGENGEVRIVGISHSFKSAWAAYDMDCTAPATSDFQTLLPPTLQMQVIPQEKVMVGQQLCVSRVKIVGKIVGRGPMSGYAGFVGDHNYISPPQAYEVQQGDIELIVAGRDIDWTADPQATYTTGPAPAGQPKKKTIDIGFNVTGSNNAIVASLPKRGFTFTCSFPTLNPAVVGGSGLTAAPRPQPAPSAPRRLQQHEGSGQPALQVQPKLRLPRKQ